MRGFPKRIGGKLPTEQAPDAASVIGMSLKASARRLGSTFRHEIAVDGYTIITDEPHQLGGTGTGPTPHQLLPASLAACVATTIELYARRKNWDVGEVAVDVAYDRDAMPHHFDIDVRVADDLSSEQLERIMRIAAKCPVRRALESGFSFDERLVGAPRVAHKDAA
jgi:putative redox protein